ncbi:Kinesin light chain [Caligus rogercresseyi]|uniref:Kinesin light chain n=1 Tax=Caligus rogercresseyi TaxID=217165 RepID=A0A7T8QVX1_CALRO|nr:Kinesin light chain [Caligus rogercresseyi]
MIEDEVNTLLNLTQDQIVDETKAVRNGLRSLKNDHYNILGSLREEFSNEKNAGNPTSKETEKNGLTNGLESRLSTVNSSLEKLDIGIEESSVLIGLSEHFQRIESDRSVLRLEMGRISDENDWLREELAETQRKLKEAYEEIEELQLERREMQFNEEIRNMSESNLRPITPSKIPVGAWRVEEEKAINNALDPITTTSKQPRPHVPLPRLPHDYPWEHGEPKSTHTSPSWKRRK